MTRLFITGATGYIGGEVLYRATKAIPGLEVTALVRDVQKGKQVSKAYPDVHIVHGDLDDLQFIEKAASEADVVVHAAATGHINSVKAIHKGLAARSKGGYFIQISGATVISQDEIKNKRFGESSTKVFPDYPDLSALKDEIQRHPNRTVDIYFLGLTRETPNVQTAIVFAPIIYGKGEGPCHQRSIQIPELCRIAIERGRGVQTGKGLNRWGNVNVADLGEMFALLVKRAAEGSEEKEVWGEDGLYFAGAGKEITFGEISERIVKAASEQGLIEEKPVESISADEIDKLSPHASAVMGTNARENAQRAKKVLGWSPHHHTLEDEIPRAVQVEAQNNSSK